MTTAFDSALADGVTASRALDGMPQRKLSATAFLAKALANADCTQGDLDALEAKMKRVGTPAAQSFMRRVVKPFDSGNIPSPDRKWQRLASVYGGPGLGDDVNLLRTNIPILYALAIRCLIEKRPGHFGTVESLDEYDAQVAQLRDDLAKACEKMRSVVSGDDLLIEHEGLPVNLRDQGLVKVSFRVAPDVVMCGDWPSVLIDWSKAQVVPKQGRRRLAA